MVAVVGMRCLLVGDRWDIVENQRIWGSVLPEWRCRSILAEEKGRDVLRLRSRRYWVFLLVFLLGCLWEVEGRVRTEGMEWKSILQLGRVIEELFRLCKSSLRVLRNLRVTEPVHPTPFHHYAPCYAHAQVRAQQNLLWDIW